VLEDLTGREGSACKLHHAHFDAMSYHTTLSTILRQIMDIVDKRTPTPAILLARLVPLVTLEDNIQNYNVL
jgi:hypothetical protein